MKAISIITSCCLVAIVTQLEAQPVSVPMVNLELQPVAVVSISVNNKTVALPAVYADFNQGNALCQKYCIYNQVSRTFEGKRIADNLVMLTWKTVNDYNGVGFNLQRSLGNQLQFETIIYMRAQPGDASIKKYSYPDSNTYSGITYYRLQEMLPDTQTVMSKTIAIDNKGHESLALYPNPVHNILNIEYMTGVSAGIHILVYGSQGQVYMRQANTAHRGLNLYQTNVTTLIPGTYFLKIVSDKGSNLISTFLKN